MSYTKTVKHEDGRIHVEQYGMRRGLFLVLAYDGTEEESVACLSPAHARKLAKALKTAAERVERGEQ